MYSARGHDFRVDLFSSLSTEGVLGIAYKGGVWKGVNRHPPPSFRPSLSASPDWDRLPSWGLPDEKRAVASSVVHRNEKGS